MDHLTIHCRLKKIVLSMIYLAILKAEGKKYINCKHFYCGYMKMCRALIINSYFLNFITTFCWFYWIRFTCDVRGENRIYCFLWTARNLTFYMQFRIKVLNFVKSFIENLFVKENKFSEALCFIKFFKKPSNGISLQGVDTYREEKYLFSQEKYQVRIYG